MFVDYSDSDGEPDLGKKQVVEVGDAKVGAGVVVNLAPAADSSALVTARNEEKSREMVLIYGNEKKEAGAGHLTGKVEKYSMHSFSFDEQFYKFKNRGFAHDPSLDISRMVVDESKFPELAQRIHRGENIDPSMIDVYGTYTSLSEKEKEKQKELKSLREKTGSAVDGTYRGPWANYEGENVKPPELTMEDRLQLEKKRLEEKEQAVQKKKDRKKGRGGRNGPRTDNGDDSGNEAGAAAEGEEEGEGNQENKEGEEPVAEESEKKKRFNKYDNVSVFHDAIPYFDYKGRSYIQPPLDVKPRDHVCYTPKKQVHCWTGHTKGVQAIRFFPKYGHFLLSASLDSTVKLWDVMGNKKCVRTYSGHSMAVRDIEFTNDGHHFLSCSYDKNVLYWDTETGKVVKSFNIKKYPYQARFNPDAGKQSSFILASSNKKISQYDVRSGARTQVYDEHLGSVNTVTFTDYGRKFVSTSDDKKIFLWGFGIGVVEKHLAEPDMTAVSHTGMHPTERFFAGQCSDNKIQIYDTKGGNFRLNRKKVFNGHTSAGYSVGLDFSADGQYICSGDADGRAFFWDWKSGKNYKVIQAHDGVCIDIRWHPIETSKVATCGWDGLIKYWD